MTGTPWHVLGVGSVGTLWACRFARAGLPVRLLLRDASRLGRYREGAGLQLVEGSFETAFALPAETVDAPGPIHRLLVACKAYDAEAAATSIRPRLSAGAQVVLLQNGLGSQQAVASLLAGAEVTFASTTEGAWTRPDGAVVFAGQGFTWLGTPQGSAAPAWLNDLTRAAIPHQWTPDILMRLWRKLAINCAINPLTVLEQCPNGGLRAHTRTLAVVCQELAALLHAVGQAGAACGLAEDVDSVIEATARNYSSMYQDVAAGRRTEVHYLIGYACAEARRAGVPVPTLDALHEALLAKLRTLGLPTN